MVNRSTALEEAVKLARSYLNQFRWFFKPKQKSEDQYKQSDSRYILDIEPIKFAVKLYWEWGQEEAIVIDTLYNFSLTNCMNYCDIS